MSGNWRSGRRSIPIPNSSERPYEPPDKPSDLDEHGAFLWESFVVPAIDRQIVDACDSVTLWMLCEVYSLYRRAVEKANGDPLDKDSRIAVCAYFRAFSNVAANFGTNRSTRAKLAPKTTEPTKGIQPRSRRAVAGRIGDGK